MSSTKLRIAVIGAGISGLTFALALSKATDDIHVDVYEGARTISEIGAGIVLWARSWPMLQKLGVFDELAATRPGFEAVDEQKIVFHIRKGDQPEGFRFGDLSSRGGVLQLRRADLQATLLRPLLSTDTVKIHTSKRVISYVQPSPPSSSPIVIDFQDGSSAECDLLIGADGVHSVIRAALFSDMAVPPPTAGPQSVKAFWSGMSIYRSLISAEKLQNLDPKHSALSEATQYVGKNAYVITFRVGANQINFVGFIVAAPWGAPLDGPAVRDASREEVLEYYKGWERNVQTLLQCLDTVKLWSVEVCPTLETMVSGRVALVGDAGHAMVPSQGAGGGQAIDDAFLLSTLIADPRVTLDMLPKALQIYSSIRLPFVQEVARRSRRQADLLSRQQNAEWADDQALIDSPDLTTENVAWASTTYLETDIKRALAMLDD